MKAIRNKPDAPGMRGGRAALAIVILLGFIAASAHPGNTGLPEPETIPGTRQLVKQIYTSQIGVREKETNSGPAVEQYLRYVSLPKGNPWCAAFVCWVFGQAGVENPRSGWSPDLFGAGRVIWERAAGEKGIKSKEQGAKNKEQGLPRTGDVFGLFFPEKKRIAHAGFIDQWDGTWLVTVEGNTNMSGSREGDGVYRKRRLVKSVYKVARYVGDK